MKKQSYHLAIIQIIRAGHWITDSVSMQLKSFDISEPQFNVLKTLKANQSTPLTVEQIGKEMVQRSSNVTRIIDKLLSKGLVTRQECPTNRRKMDIAITPQGLVFLEKLEEKVLEFHDPLFDKLTEQEFRTVASLIRKLRK